MMEHPGEGQLQAFLDRELPVDQVEEVERHLLRCDDCRERVEELRRAEALASGALAQLDPETEVELDAVRWEVRRRRARRRAVDHRRRLAAAAVVVLLLGAGAAAAMPGSPLRTWLAGEPEVPATALQDGEPAVAALTVALRDGRAWVEVGELGAATTVEVAVVDAEGLEVEVPVGASFLTGPGRIDVSRLPADGRLRIAIPEGAREVEISVAGDRRVTYGAAGLLIDGEAAGREEAGARDRAAPDRPAPLGEWIPVPREPASPAEPQREQGGER